MLFVTPHTGLQVTGFRQPKDNYHPASGNYIDTTPGVDIEFIHASVPPWAVEVALGKFEFRGLPEGAVPALYLAAYDTDQEAFLHGWSDEFKQELDEWLLRQPGYGQEFIRIDPPNAGPPWANYDEMHPKRLAPTARQLGLIDEALAYERATKNRPGVVTALEESVPDPEPDPDDELVAA